MDQETINGFDIPKRELTQEEATREITLDRFNKFHTEAGEDFCDTCGSFINHRILGGYLIAKHPSISLQILGVLNNKYGDALELLQLYQEELEDESGDLFYSELAEFANLTVGLRKNINQVLIQLAEHYGY